MFIFNALELRFRYDEAMNIYINESLPFVLYMNLIFIIDA